MLGDAASMATPTHDGSPKHQATPPPVIPPEVHLQEITVRGLLLSVALAAVLAAANAYLGLFAGMTVSASIPAAVLSMAILRWCRGANILENNIVQTAASSGEALAAGVIFTLPALVLLGDWHTFHYWDTMLIAGIGGSLGVLFTIPLRRALVCDSQLRFPEGVATAEVLKAGMGAQTGTTELRALLAGSLFGGIMKVGESGLRLWTDSLEGATRAGATVIYAGINLSPALLAVGAIVGLPIAAVVFGGGVLGWLIILPLDGWSHGVPDSPDAITSARMLWSTRLRSVGIGAMLVGGLWTLIQVRGPILASVSRLSADFRRSMTISHDPTYVKARLPRTDRDTPGVVLLALLLVCLLGTLYVYQDTIHNGWIALLMAIAMVAAAFVFASVAGYMAGLVGSSSNPVSGVTIATLMLTASLLVLVLGTHHPAGPAAALMIAAIVCCAAAMGGDNLQDLKTGQLVGATPWKQQIMQFVGVGTGAVVLAPTLSLLQARYGIGLPNDSHPQSLSAPQATLMANLARGLFTGDLPWGLVGIGGGIGTLTILLDRWLVRRNSSWRTPVLAVALGLYLPLKLTAAVMLGGIIHALAIQGSKSAQRDGNRGLLAAAGLITGEALMGILLAIPMALTSLWPTFPSDPFALPHVAPYGAWPGVCLLGGLGWFLFRSARQRRA